MDTGSNSELGTTVFYITANGLKLAQRLAKDLGNAEVIKFNSGYFARKWDSAKNIICIMAAGIVVRAAAPLLKDKRIDPAVLVIDEKGTFVISLLSGHIGGANALAEEVAGYLGAQAIITTASDVQGRLSLDLWAIENNLHIEDFETIKRLSAKIVNGRRVKLHAECPLTGESLPEELILVDSIKEAEIVITDRIIDEDVLCLRPKDLFVGIGCNRGTVKQEIADVFHLILQREKLSFHSINSIASIDLKKDEQGLVDFTEDAGLGIEFFSKDDLNDAAIAHNIAESEAVKAATGAVAVAEAAAVSGAKKMFGNCAIITPKVKRGNVTLAIAKAEFTL